MREMRTPELTRTLEKAMTAHQPPLVHGRRIKLRYAHQGGKQSAAHRHSRQPDRARARCVLALSRERVPQDVRSVRDAGVAGIPHGRESLHRRPARAAATPPAAPARPLRKIPAARIAAPSRSAWRRSTRKTARPEPALAAANLPATRAARLAGRSPLANGAPRVRRRCVSCRSLLSSRRSRGRVLPLRNRPTPFHLQAAEIIFLAHRSELRFA